ncbi:MAG: aldo/keto reductase [Armatimonadota bacterium]
MVAKSVELPSGNKMPTLGLGTWTLRGEEGLRTIRSALEMGYRHIDTADMYGNHDIVGQAIADYPRQELFVTSKVDAPDLHYDDVLLTCRKNLRELDTDYIDLYLIHWPNPDLPMKQTFDALRHLVEEGLIRDLGVSNFQQHRMEQALEIADHPIAVNQIELHPLLYQHDLIELCQDNGVAVTAYSPLARGRVYEDETLREIAEAHGRTPGQVSLRWLLQKGCIVIPRSKNEEHLRENMDIYGWSLSDEDVALIDAIEEQVRLIEPDFPEFEMP